MIINIITIQRPSSNKMYMILLYICMCTHIFFLAKKSIMHSLNGSCIKFCFFFRLFQIFKVQLFVIIIFAKTWRVVFWLLAVNNRSMTIIIYTIIHISTSMHQNWTNALFVFILIIFVHCPEECLIHEIL